MALAGEESTTRLSFLLSFVLQFLRSELYQQQNRNKVHRRGNHDVYPNGTLTRLTTIIHQRNTLPIRLLIPINGNNVRLNFNKLRTLPLDRRRGPRPTTRLTLHLLIRPLPRLLRHLPTRNWRPIGISTIYLRTRVRLPLLNGMITHFRPLKRGTNRLVTRLPSRLLLYPIFDLYTTLYMRLPNRPITRHDLTYNVNNTLFIAVVTISLRLGNRPTRQVKLSNLRGTNVPSRFRQQRNMRLHPHPRTLNLISHRRLGVQINRQCGLLFLRRLPMGEVGTLRGNTIRHYHRRLFLILQNVQNDLLLYRYDNRLLDTNYRRRPTIPQLDRTRVFRFRTISLLLGNS